MSLDLASSALEVEFARDLKERALAEEVVRRRLERTEVDWPGEEEVEPRVRRGRRRCERLVRRAKCCGHLLELWERVEQGPPAVAVVCYYSGMDRIHLRLLIARGMALWEVKAAGVVLTGKMAVAELNLAVEVEEEVEVRMVLSLRAVVEELTREVVEARIQVMGAAALVMLQVEVEVEERIQRAFAMWEVALVAFSQLEVGVLVLLQYLASSVLRPWMMAADCSSEQQWRGWGADVLQVVVVLPLVALVLLLEALLVLLVPNSATTLDLRGMESCFPPPSSHLLPSAASAFRPRTTLPVAAAHSMLLSYLLLPLLLYRCCSLLVLPEQVVRGLTGVLVVFPCREQAAHLQ